MIQMNDSRIDEMVARVLERFGGVSAPPPADSTPGLPSPPGPGLRDDIPRGTLGVYADPDAALQAARRGQLANEALPLATRHALIEAMRKVTRAHLHKLAAYTMAETGLGRFEDKVGKNALIADKTPGIEILQPKAFSGDDGLTLVERAPCGVILAVTPCTNPTETILCNAISMLAGGNAVVFNVHPAAARVSNWFVHLLSEAIVAAGGPRDLIVSLESPSIDSAKLLMNHPGVDMVVVTGGGGVIRQALQSGKRVIAAGPGNPPVVVDETANLDQAAAAIIKGCATDNNLICAAEKEIIAVDSIADELIRRLTGKSCLLLDRDQVRALERVVLDGDQVSRKWVGKDASLIAEQIGLRGHGSDLRLLLCEVDEQHPFVQHELLMPVIGLVRARDAAGAMAMAMRVEHGYRHTVVMHSTNIVNLSAMGRVCGATIYVMNDWHMAGMGLGGEGYTSCTIATTTGEGLTTALNFTRERRCALKNAFRFV